jgi:hypothetical protein
METAPGATDVFLFPSQGYTWLCPTNLAKCSKERSYVASASGGKKQAGSCLARR